MSQIKSVVGLYFAKNVSNKTTTMSVSLSQHVPEGLKFLCQGSFNKHTHGSSFMSNY